MLILKNIFNHQGISEFTEKAAGLFWKIIFNARRIKPEIWYFIIIFSVVFVLCPISSIAVTAENKKPGAAGTVKTGGETGETAAVEKPGNKGTAKEDAGIYDDYERPVVEEESYGWLLFKTIIILGALVGGFYYFFRFVTKKTGIHALGQDVIKVLSIVPVGQNKFLQVVDVAGRIMILGVTDSNITLITEVSGRDEIDRIRLLSSKSVPVQPGGFQQLIARQVIKFFNRDSNTTSGKKDSSHHQEKKSEDRMDYLKKQKDRLKGLNGNNDEI